MNGQRLFVQSNLYILALQTLVRVRERERERELERERDLEREREREGLYYKTLGHR